MGANTKQTLPFTGYQKLVIAILAFLQFTVVLDFMIVAPLGAVLMPALRISPSQFGIVVSAYAFSAGLSGFLAAGFADRFDRKKLLLFFYMGFVLGTLMCGLVETYELLVAARIITGLFGGVIGAIVFAIITDLFPLEKRGQVIGVVQTAFAASQVLGLPAGLYFSNLWGWQAPFLMIVVLSVIAGGVIFSCLKPIDAHLKLRNEQGPGQHLVGTLTQSRYLIAFGATALLSVAGFMLMPFATAYTVHNLGISADYLPLMYLVTGFAAIIIGPVVGRTSDKFGNLRLFTIGTAVSICTVLVYTNLGVTPLVLVILINIVMFAGTFSRMIPAQALMSSIPSPASRGAFMAVSSSLQQMAGGFGAVLAGLIVVEGPTGLLERFNVIGYVVVGAALVTLYLMWRIQRLGGSAQDDEKGKHHEAGQTKAI